MVRIVVISLLIALVSPTALPNVGYFHGSGLSIQLMKTDQIQLVSEEVNIHPQRGAMVPFMDRVVYNCAFTLKNLTEKDVSIQVGFPLNTGVLNCPYGPMYTESKEVSPELEKKLVVETFGFLVRDSEKTYHVNYVKEDRDQQFLHLFLWNMDFAPHETRTLNVRYEMPTSHGFFSLGDRADMSNRFVWGYAEPAWDPQALPEWYSWLEYCYIECFFYITETASSWAGEIEEARFIIKTYPFEECGTGLGIRKDVPSQIGKKAQDIITSFEGEEFRYLEPSGWNKTKTGMELVCKNYKPQKNIQYRYYYTNFPKSSDKLAAWIRAVFKNNPSRRNLDDLREIILAFYGIKPESEGVLSFVKTQIWYDPDSTLEEETLSEDRKAVLKKLDHILAGIKK